MLTFATVIRLCLRSVRGAAPAYTVYSGALQLLLRDAPVVVGGGEGPFAGSGSFLGGDLRAPVTMTMTTYEARIALQVRNNTPGVRLARPYVTGYKFPTCAGESVKGGGGMVRMDSCPDLLRCRGRSSSPSLVRLSAVRLSATRSSPMSLRGSWPMPVGEPQS